MDYNTDTGNRNKIKEEITKAFKLLGAKPDLLRIIGNYGDGFTEEEILEGLSKWNESKRIEILQKTKEMIYILQDTGPEVITNDSQEV